MKFLKLLFLFIILNISCHTNSSQITVIPTNNSDEQTWQTLKDLFVKTFADAYKHTDIKDINNNFTSTSDYLESLFDTDRKAIENLNFNFILATENQEILGYILSCYSAESKKIYIHHLVVDTSKHNKGIGKILIKACENCYQEANYISLSTRRFNHKAIGFYKHIGFYETESAPDIAYVIRPNARNNPQVINLEKIISKS